MLISELDDRVIANLINLNGNYKYNSIKIKEVKKIKTSKRS